MGELDHNGIDVEGFLAPLNHYFVNLSAHLLDIAGEKIVNLPRDED